MYFKSFFKFFNSYFVEKMTFSSLLFVFSLFFFVDFFLLPNFSLLYSLHLVYFAHLCLYFCTTQLSILDTYSYLLNLSFLLSLSCNTQTRTSFLPKYLFLRAFTLLIFPYSSKKYFNSSSDTSDHSSLVTNRLVFFLHDFIRCSFDPHASQAFLLWSCFSSTGFLYLLPFSLVYYYLGYLFASCVYIHLLHFVLFCLASLLLVLLVLLLLSKPFLCWLFTLVCLVLFSYFLLPNIVQVLF